jgi:hypothetical protein
MLLNATFNNISVMTWLSLLLVEETANTFGNENEYMILVYVY